MYKHDSLFSSSYENESQNIRLCSGILTIKGFFYKPVCSNDSSSKSFLGGGVEGLSKIQLAAQKVIIMTKGLLKERQHFSKTTTKKNA